MTIQMLPFSTMAMKHRNIRVRRAYLSSCDNFHVLEILEDGPDPQAPLFMAQCNYWFDAHRPPRGRSALWYSS